MAENYFGLTDTGRVRSNNEDAFITQRIFNDRLILACVIDGVGGYEGGEVAAAIAKETITDVFAKEEVDVLGQMRQAFTAANERIAAAKHAEKGNDSMACVLTLVIADTEKNKFFYAHVGDTRLYLFRDASLVKVSKDHSFVGFLEDTGRLSEDAAMQHPKRNEINKALGFDSTVTGGEDYIETDESPFLPGDLLLLCSDGLTDLVNKTEIAALLAKQLSLAEKGAQLVAAANDKGGKDNITVALVYHDKAPVKQKATKPPPLKKNEIPKPEDQAVAHSAVQSATPVKKEKTNVVLFLSILSTGLLLALAWAMWQLWNKPTEPALSTMATNTKNEQEQKLQALISHAASDTIVLSDSVFTQPVEITDTILVARPALYLKGNGAIRLSAGDGYEGAAFLLSSNNKLLVLDSLVFNNFSIAIATPHKNISLHNVRFNQCRIAVASYTSFPDMLYINGLLADTLLSADSIPKPVK